MNRTLLLFCALGLWSVHSLSQKIKVTPLAENAVRIQYEKPAVSKLTEMVYVDAAPYSGKMDIKVAVNDKDNTVSVKNGKGKTVFRTTSISLTPSTIQDEPCKIAEMSFVSPLRRKEHQYGLGQFQDGYSDVRGLTRRLTQVNTQISIPMLMSSNGYAILWNNYGMTEFNPCSNSARLESVNEGAQTTEVVNATSTTGNRREVRRSNTFGIDIQIDEDGEYTLLLDVGQQMARKHWLSIDDSILIDVSNTWLPPTTSLITQLSKGTHKVRVRGSWGDKPVLYWEKVDGVTTFRSPVAECVDFTVFVGNADEIVNTYRILTGKAPQMPRYALGYIHCRERYHSQEEIIATARRFQKENIPLDVIVQDWQWWGKYGWNAMRFDEDFYPSPALMMDTLHAMNVRLMLSVWSKIDKNSDVGKEASANDYYIKGTDWIDFFNPEAAAFYWKNFRERLLPSGIDCWWQDATEPENDDLLGRKVADGRLSGEWVRNIYPLMVNKTVYEGIVDAKGHDHQSFILTRSGFTGIQRYGTAMWSGDVGNDWETLRRQICGGLGLMSTGIPWWTYDAGGFFRPGSQYTDEDYQKRMVRWIQASVFLPLMRVHGYMSNTEPWNYSQQTYRLFTEAIRLRHKLLPYITKESGLVASDNYTLMRPLYFDFPDDDEALIQDTEFMFGHNYLVCPVTVPSNEMRVYLPKSDHTWYDCWTGTSYKGGQYVTMPLTLEHIPVFTNDKTMCLL